MRIATLKADAVNIRADPPPPPQFAGAAPNRRKAAIP